MSLEAFFKSGATSVQFKRYRSTVNRERKECRANYYESRVQQMKGEHPKAWWKEVKRLSGMQSRKFLEVTEERTYKLLSRLNPAKATGHDGLPNWLLREFARLVAFPVKTILNASFSEQRLPSSWKYADVTPLLKKTPVQNLKKDLNLAPRSPTVIRKGDLVKFDFEHAHCQRGPKYGLFYHCACSYSLL